MKPIEYIERGHAKALAAFIEAKANSLAEHKKGEHSKSHLFELDANYELGCMRSFEDCASLLDDRIGDSLMAASSKARNEAWDAFLATFKKGAA